MDSISYKFEAASNPGIVGGPVQSPRSPEAPAGMALEQRDNLVAYLDCIAIKVARQIDTELKAPCNTDFGRSSAERIDMQEQLAAASASLSETRLLLVSAVTEAAGLRGRIALLTASHDAVSSKGHELKIELGAATASAEAQRKRAEQSDADLKRAREECDNTCLLLRHHLSGFPNRWQGRAIQRPEAAD